MYNLIAEERDSQLKAKKIRNAGMVPCSIYGGKLKKTLLIQISQVEATKLLKEKGRGGRLKVECDGKKHDVIVKEISWNNITNQVENVDFQGLSKEKEVCSTAQIILKNKNKIPVMIQQLIREIPYKALPANLVEKIEIDMKKFKKGDTLKVKELPIWNNPDIEVLMEGELLVMNMPGISRGV
ncbi:MAG: 50S ribosomal protein L25 [Aminipila sp.]